MKKVTRELIKLRQKYVANPKAIQHISSVSKIGGGELNQCYQNAFKSKAPEAFGGSMMSGWYVTTTPKAKRGPGERGARV